MKENNSTNWSKGVRFVQWQMNSNNHSTIRETPYYALFGSNPRCGFANKVTEDFIRTIGCSDIREEVMESMIQDYENQILEECEINTATAEEEIMIQGYENYDSDMSKEDIPTVKPGEEETYVGYDFQLPSDNETQFLESTSPKRTR